MRLLQDLNGCISVGLCAFVHVCVLFVVLKGGRATKMVGGAWGVGLRIPLTGGGESQSNRIRGYTNSKTAQCCQNGLV